MADRIPMLVPPGTYPDMLTLVPEGQLGEVSIRHTPLTSFQASLENIRYLSGGYPAWMLIDPSTYVRLIIDGVLMMSDSPMEKRTNLPFIDRAQGHVLIGGLGIGMLPAALLLTKKKQEIRSVTIIEKSFEVIALVESHIAHPKLRVIHGDIFEVNPPDDPGIFDTIYFDIWPDIAPENLPEMMELHDRYRQYLNRENPNAWMSSWLLGHCRTMRKEDLRIDRRKRAILRWP